MLGNAVKHKFSAAEYADMAISKSNEGDIKTALEYSNIAVTREPNNDYFHYIQGVLYSQNKDNKKAEKKFIKAVKLNPNNPLYYYNLGLTNKKIGNITDSLNNQKKALKLANNNVLCLNEIGLLYIELRQLNNAESSLKKAYQLNPNDIATCANLSHLYITQQKIPEAIQLALQATKIDPTRPEPYSTLGKAYIFINEHKKGIDYLKQAIEKKSKNPAFLHQSILMNMLYTEDYTAEEIFEEHKIWARQYLKEDKGIEKEKTTKVKVITTIKNKVLNIGFVSADFKAHSIGYFLMPLLENINKEKYAVSLYSSALSEDNVSKQYKKTIHCWRNIHKKNEIEILSMIEKDKIDILIDLSGHSLGTQLNIFNKKPTPIQMTYLGYPFSTGLSTIDYRITDNICDPINKTEHFHSESLLRITPSFLCYKPDKLIPIADEIPFTKNNFITFGSFNNFSKLSHRTLSTWATLLKKVDNAQLLLKSSLPPTDLLKQNLLKPFIQLGIASNRIVFHKNIKNKDEHMALYNTIDICLDPFPYNGTTTTFEAILMGVPVICLRGEAHHGRVSSSILSNLDANELIANSTDEYIYKAIALAYDTSKIKQYRHTLREKLLSSPLTDEKTFTRKFEKVLDHAWNNYCDGS